jgi:hypothetical protein
VSAELPTGHFAIARLLREGGTWRSDRSFEAARV